jgi:hypothetical protein
MSKIADFAKKHNCSEKRLSELIKNHVNFCIEYNINITSMSYSLFDGNLQYKGYLSLFSAFHNAISMNGLPSEDILQILEELYSIIQDAYKTTMTKNYSKKYTIFVNNTYQNFDIVDDAIKCYQLCVDIKCKPIVYCDGKLTTIDEIKPVQSIEFSRYYDFKLEEKLKSHKEFNDGFLNYKYKNYSFTSYPYIDEKPGVKYIDLDNINVLLDNEFTSNIKGIVYVYQNESELKLVYQLVELSKSTIPVLSFPFEWEKKFDHQILDLLTPEVSSETSKN